MAKAKKRIGRIHKRGTGRSKHTIHGAAGVGPFYGNMSSTTVEETQLSAPSNDVDEGNPVVFVAVGATREPPVRAMPDFVPSFASIVFPIFESYFQEQREWFFMSITMTRAEYGALLVAMGNSKSRLPNLQSEMILANIQVTLEFSHDDYTLLLESKEIYSANDMTMVSL